MSERAGIQKARVDRLVLPEPNIFLNREKYGIVAITSYSLTSNVATINFSEKVYWQPGYRIVVEGINSTFNGVHEITSSTHSGTTTLTFTKTATDVPLTTAPTDASAYRYEMLAYFARYRVTSDRGNSAWSTVHKAYANYWFRRQPGITMTNSIQVSKIGTGRATAISWDPIDLMIDDNFIRQPQYYDVWLQWYKTVPSGNTAKWIYEERVASTSLTVNIPSQWTYINNTTGVETVVNESPQTLAVEIRLRSNPPMRQRQISWTAPNYIDRYEDSKYLLAYASTHNP